MAMYDGTTVLVDGANGPSPDHCASETHDHQRCFRCHLRRYQMIRNLHFALYQTRVDCGASVTCRLPCQTTTTAAAISALCANSMRGRIPLLQQI